MRIINYYLCLLNNPAMLYLLFALFFSTCIFITFKYFEKYRINILPAIATNYLGASVLGYASGKETAGVSMLVQQPWVFMAVATGAAFILTFVVFAVSTQKVGVAMTVVSGKMSIIISVAVGYFLVSEPLNLLQMVGILIALAAFYLTNAGQDKVKIEKRYLFLPLLMFAGTGANDSLMKLSGVYFPGRDEINFLTVTFFTAFVLGLCLVFYRLFQNSLKISWKDIGTGLLLSFFNWYSTYFFIKGLGVLPISLFVPVFNAAIVFIAAVAGYFFFKEKLSVTNRFGIVLAVLAIALIALS